MGGGTSKPTTIDYVVSVNGEAVDTITLSPVATLSSPGNDGGKDIASYNVYDSMEVATNPVTIVGAVFLSGEFTSKKAENCYDDDVNTFGQSYKIFTLVFETYKDLSLFSIHFVNRCENDAVKNFSVHFT